MKPFNRTTYDPLTNTFTAVPIAKFDRELPREITLQEALEYELRASWWAPFIAWPNLQDRVASYFAWKAKRKHARYANSRDMRAIINRL